MDSIIRISVDRNYFSNTSYRDFRFLIVIGEGRVPLSNLIAAEFGTNNWLISLSKSSETFLENPYKSDCIHYDRDETPFNSKSQIDCKRQCFRYYCEAKQKCFVWIYEYMIEEFEQNFRNNYENCNESQIRECQNTIKRKNCSNICPVNCFKEQYYLSGEMGTNYLKSSSVVDIELSWDSTQPFIAYKETADMPLLDYFTYIGGLLGLWFGLSLNTFIDLIIFYIKIIKLKSKILINLIIIYTKIIYSKSKILINLIIVYTKITYSKSKVFINLIIVYTKIIVLKLKILINYLIDFMTLSFWLLLEIIYLFYYLLHEKIIRLKQIFL